MIRKDVPGPFAKDLETLVLPELADHVAKWDPHPNSTKGSGVWNWFVFERRYAWMIEMFRTQADNREITGGPIS